MGKYTVAYFVVRGRGEVIRLILTAANQEFVDRRVTYEEWPKEKPKTPTGVLPVVTTPDGRVMNESLAIARFLAHEYGFMGSGNWDLYRVERAVGAIMDLQEAMTTIYFTPAAEKEKKLEEFMADKGPHLLKVVTGYIDESKGSFFLGSKVSLADFCLMNVWDTIKKNAEKLAKDNPKIEAHYQAVCKALPKIASYIKSRPQSDI